jgi:putative CocE/NonD family hydrolase
MKDRDERAPAEPRVRYFVMGKGAWRTSDTWPPATTPLTLHLRSGGAANGAHGDGVLSTVDPAPDEPGDGFRYDPLDPVPTRGGATLAPAELGGEGIQDQTPVEERPDVLVYTSPVLRAPVLVAGQVTLTLYAASSAVDTDFTAKLVDVEPGGFRANICEGIVRARHRAGFDRDELIEPGKVYELTVRLFDVAHSFDAGHRIRLEVSSSNFPRFARNLNSAVHPHVAGPDDVVVAVQQVFHNSDHPSRLVLPVLPAGRPD